MFLKKKELIIDCYTSNSFAYNYAKINHGRHYIPEWFKKTPKIANKEMTIKNCPGIVEYYTKSIVLPMWCEFRIEIQPKGSEILVNWKGSSEVVIDPHIKEQFDGFAEEDGYNFKIVSPWFLKCKEDISFTYTQPVWSQRDTMFNLVLQPGVIQFKSNNQTNLNYFYKQTDEKQVLNIEPLTPMLMLHPMTERKIKLRHHFTNTDHFATPNNGLLLDNYPEVMYQKKKRLFDKIDKIEKGTYDT